MNLVKLSILFAFATGCAMFEERDYFNQMNDFGLMDRPIFSANEDFMVISGDTGRYHRSSKQIWNRTPAKAEDIYERRYQDSLRRELRFLEAKLTDSEFYQFDRYRGDIGDISEQIYFLRLRAKERKEYLNMRNIASLKGNTTQRGAIPKRISSERHQYQSSSNDIMVGMSMESVLANWGTPDRRDIAGKPSYRNERWAFRKNGVMKYIYFESGIVQGWTEE